MTDASPAAPHADALVTPPPDAPALGSSMGGAAAAQVPTTAPAPANPAPESGATPEHDTLFGEAAPPQHRPQPPDAKHLADVAPQPTAGVPTPAPAPGATPAASHQRHWGLPHLGKHQPADSPIGDAPEPKEGVNLRDVGAVAADELKEGVFFRSSEIMSSSLIRQFGVRTVLDLRRMDRPCQKRVPIYNKCGKLLWYLIKGPRMIVPEDKQLYATRGQPHVCERCSKLFSQRHGYDAKVVHADLIPMLVGLRIFMAMPASVRFRAILAALSCKGAASVMAGAVANPHVMGYRALYRTILEDAQRGLAKALRLFSKGDAFPILIHCIHGKDRTGLVVMLLLLLCGVAPEAVVEDYMKSEQVLKASRMHHELNLDVYLTTDEVISAGRQTMEDTIALINDKHGGIVAYLRSVGLEDWEMDAIRANLLKHGPAAAAAKERLATEEAQAAATAPSPGQRLSARISSFFRKRSPHQASGAGDAPDGPTAGAKPTAAATAGAGPNGMRAPAVNGGGGTAGFATNGAVNAG